MPVHSAHVLTGEAIEIIRSENPAAINIRGTRGSAKQKKENDNFGYHTFRRGDVVVWIGEQEDEDIEYTEIVYGAISCSHRGQQRRFLLTYCVQQNLFSANTWCVWKRVLRSGVASLSPFIG